MSLPSLGYLHGELIALRAAMTKRHEPGWSTRWQVFAVDLDRYMTTNPADSDVLKMVAWVRSVTG